VTGALVVFCVTYLLIASRQLHFLGLDRPAGALVGAVAMVVVGGLPLDAALHAIDLHVLVLLFGVLVIAAYLQEARFFRYVAYLVLTRARSARSLLLGLVVVAGALSALLVNDTVCVVLTPLVVAVVVEARLPALPYLLALASASNVGGVVSFSGNPQNMIIGDAAQGTISFAHYLLVMLPAGAACLAATGGVLLWLFRAQLPAGPLVDRSGFAGPRSGAEGRRGVEIDRSPGKPAVELALCLKALAGLALFAGLALAGFALAGAAMAGAAAVLVAARTTEHRRVFATVDWMLLVFFAALFVVVAGLAKTGALADAFDALAPMVARGDVAGDVAFIAFVVIASNLVSNVPLVLVAVAWVPHMPDPRWGYVMLAVASTLAGNLTLFGSVANIIVMEGAGPRGDIGFRRFLRYGAVITAVDLMVAFGVLALERALGVL
jgi:Na+/H+ antiporter NhaD/arsenite permease-like protein